MFNNNLLRLIIGVCCIFEISFSACREDKKEAPKNSNVNIVIDVNHLDSNAEINSKLVKIKKGDTTAYKELSDAYFMENELHTFYYYSLLMANKYNFRLAYLDLYLALSEPYTGEGFEELDYKTKRMAIFYLLRAYELGENRAADIVNQIFPKGKIPSSKGFGKLE